MSRLSPALVVAVLALVAALSGVAIAGPAKKVTTKKVKKISDKEINKLAPGLSVAHAGTADSAATANTASQVNGIEFRKISYSAGLNTGPVQIFSAGGLTLTASCGGGPTITLTATTSSSGAALDSDAFASSVDNTNTDRVLEHPFDVGDSPNLTAADGGGASLGHTAYVNAQGAGLQITWSAQRVTSPCAFNGYAAIG